jgi:hypothetical protein
MWSPLTYDVQKEKNVDTDDFSIYGNKNKNIIKNEKEMRKEKEGDDEDDNDNDGGFAPHIVEKSDNKLMISALKYDSNKNRKNDKKSTSTSMEGLLDNLDLSLMSPSIISVLRTIQTYPSPLAYIFDSVFNSIIIPSFPFLKPPLSFKDPDFEFDFSIFYLSISDQSIPLYDEVNERIWFSLPLESEICKVLNDFIIMRIEVEKKLDRK